MPRSNKIRASNIRLDKDSKIIGDETWELFGNSTLYLLENGGGKTSIIQLAHQLVLPNHKIQKREMVNNVQKGSTRHIAIEWIPDDRHRPNFVTGFCFHNYGMKLSKSNDKTYDYFNYIIEYDNDESLRIEDLPFTKEGGVTDLEQLKGMLKQTPGVHIFDSNKEYQDVLQQFGLLKSEWLNIAKINGEEGGVTEFFDNTSKTVTLIERLLIPSLTESLYDTPEEQKAILESFRKYQQNLLELPELEKNLQDFEVITKHSDSIIDSFQHFEEAKNNLETAKENLTRLYVTVLEKVDNNEEMLRELESQLDEMNIQKRMLEWKIESYQAFLLENELDQIIQTIDENEEEHRQLSTERGVLQNQIKEQKSSKEYKRYREQRRRTNDVSSQLELFKLDAEKRNSEFINTKKQVSKQYRFLLQDELAKKVENEYKHSTINQNRKEIKNDLINYQQEHSTLEKQITKLETIVEQYGSEKISTQQKIGDYWAGDAAPSNEKLQKTIIAEKIHFDNKEKNIVGLSGKINELREKNIQLENAISNTTKDLEAEQKLFDIFVRREANLKDELISTVNFSLNDDVYEEKDTILFKLDRKHREIKQTHTRLSVSLEHLTQLKNGIEQRGYHVHPEIEEVKDFLVQKGIDVISGVEWITNLSISTNEKENLLKKNPLLSFAILIESSQVNGIKSALNLYNEELSVPLVFLDRLKLDNQNEKGKFYSLEDHLHIFNQFNAKLTGEEWEKYVQSLEKVMEEKKEEEKELNLKLDELNRLVFMVKEFLKEYDSFTREKYSKRIHSLQGEIRAFKSEKQVHDNELVALTEEKEKAETTLEQLKKVLEELESKRFHIQSFMERYPNMGLVFDELEQANKSLQNVLGTITDLRQKDTTLENVLTDNQLKLKGIDEKINDLKRDFEEYGYESTEDVVPTDEEGYEKLKSYYKQLRNQNSAEQTNIQNLQEQLNTYQEMMKDAVKEIEKNGFSLESMQKLNIVYDENLLEQLELDFENVDSDIRELEKTLAVLKNNKGNKEKELETALERVEDVYEDSPFDYGQAAESEYELYKTEKESLMVKQERLEEIQYKSKETINTFTIAVEELERYKDLFVRVHDTDPFEGNEWDNQKPMNDVHQYRNTINKLQRQIDYRKNDIQRNIFELKEDAQKTGNAHLNLSLNQFIRIFEGSNYEETMESFYKMLEGIDGYKKSFETRKKISDSSRNELIEQMYQRAEVIYKNIVDIAKSSQIEEDGNIVNLIKIRWPKNDDHDIKHQLRSFVNGVLNELVKMKSEGAFDKDLEKRFDELANLFNIVNCYADVNKCSIQILKPKNEYLAKNKEYVTWDNIDTEWSGGERQTARISMFISFLNHLRKARFSKEVSWKFLILDNPFDKMQSEHVVKPMVELAKKTNTQLLAFTGIEAKSIQQEFDTVISNQYIPQNGMLLLDSKIDYKNDELPLEALFYAR